jgi:hypothetical protein
MQLHMTARQRMLAYAQPNTEEEKRLGVHPAIPKRVKPDTTK